MLEHTNRLDVEMLNRNLVRSRSQARDLILRGLVICDDEIITKLNHQVSSSTKIKVTSPLLFVSRAGEKLENALREFSLSVKNKIALDIGSSTGGFTDCLLKHGASHVTAVDVGSNQFDKNLKKDIRIDLHEETDIRDFSSNTKFDVITADVSFISLFHIFPKIHELLSPTGYALVLIKPQFEAGREYMEKTQGVILDEDIRKQIINKVIDKAKSCGLVLVKETHSSLPGENGNHEYVVLLKLH